MAAMVTACHVHFHLRSMLTHTQRVPEMARTLQLYGHGVKLLMTLMLTECTGFAMENVSRPMRTQHSLWFHVAGRAAPNTMVFLDFMFEHEVLYGSPTICSNTLHFICHSSQADAKTLLQSHQSWIPNTTWLSKKCLVRLILLTMTALRLQNKDM